MLAIERGVPVIDAIGQTAADRHLDLALTVVRACATAGGSPAEPLDRAASALRARAADAADRSVHSAQARMSAIVMTALPVAMLLLLTLTSPAIRRAALSPLGLTCITVGAVLNLAGWRWMRRVIGGVGR